MLSQKFHLHDVEKSFVKDDIHLYVQEELGEFMDEGSPMLKELVNRAGRLFIYAATACKYVLEAMHGLRLDRLRFITSIGEQSSDLQTGDINELYMRILREAYVHLETWEKKDLDLILQTVICIEVPLNTDALGELLDLGSRRVRGLLSRLHSVISVPEGDGVVTTFHASFPEYLKNPNCASQAGCRSLEATTVHGHLTESSFRLMNTNLRFNICDFPSSFLSNNMLAPSHVEAAIPSSLSYACRFWGSHMQQSHTLQVDLSHVEEFVERKLLFWFEALSCLRAVTNGARALIILDSKLLVVEAVEVDIISCGLLCRCAC